MPESEDLLRVGGQTFLKPGLSGREALGRSMGLGLSP